MKIIRKINKVASPESDSNNSDVSEADIKELLGSFER